MQCKYNNIIVIDLLTVQTDKRVFGGSWRWQISIYSNCRWTGHGIQNAVACLTRQTCRAQCLLPLAHYRVPPGQVSQRQTVNGHTGGGRTVVRLFAVPATVVIVNYQLVRRVQYCIFVVPRQSRSRPPCEINQCNLLRQLSLFSMHQIFAKNYF